jgi:Tfp pilus assembly protein PilO
MAGALEDFSRRPLQYKVLVFAGIGALLGLLYWQFVLSPLRKERDAAAADLDAQKSEASRLKEQRKQYDSLVDKEKQLKEDIEQNQKALPTEAEIPAFMDMLSRKISEAGVEMVKSDQRKDVLIEAVVAAPAGAAAGAAPAAAGAAAPASFVKVPVDVEVSGTFYQLKKFFSSLRTKQSDANAPSPSPGGGSQSGEKQRIVSIESLTITDPKVKNNEIVLTARFVASTFRAQQQTPPPGAPPAAPPPAQTPPTTPPAGASTGTGAVPPGVAAKPGSMRAKTEAAMDASEKRNEPGLRAGDEDKDKKEGGP